MSTLLWDLMRRAFYLCLYIIPIPLGAYTIHNGSSAMVALISYMVLSVCIPFFYLTSEKSGFASDNKRIQRFLYIASWLLVQASTYAIAQWLPLDYIWNLSTVGRDILFAFIMYGQICFALLGGYLLSRLI